MIPFIHSKIAFFSVFTISNTIYRVANSDKPLFFATKTKLEQHFAQPNCVQPGIRQFALRW